MAVFLCRIQLFWQLKKTEITQFAEMHGKWLKQMVFSRLRDVFRAGFSLTL
jgi:hypothetical protein